MIEVRFDEVAAMRAVHACRTGAARLRALAPLVGERLIDVRWYGGAARDAQQELQRLEVALRVEAAALDRTAEAIERALRAARALEAHRRVEAQLAEAHRARLAEASALPSWPPTAPSHGPRRSVTAMACQPATAAPPPTRRRAGAAWQVPR